jgi:predicted nucleic acid-binding protein
VKRVMLDTNVYEHVLRRFSEAELRSLFEQELMVFYGNAIVRKELRGIPAKLKIAVDRWLRSLRIVLLNLYDALNGAHVYGINPEMELLAEKYFVAYRMAGGIKSKSEILSDFIIVACATSKNLGVVVSEDAKTMLSREALSAYQLVNGLDAKRTPDFIGFKEFKEALRGVSLD